MHQDHTSLVALLVLLLGSFLMPVLSARVRVPSAVLLIAFGVGVGPSGAALVHDDRVVAFLYELGFIVLMFLAGMEIDFNAIRRRGLRALGASFAVCVAILALAFVASLALSLHPIWGLALGATSVGLPLAVLGETGAIRSRVGQTVILLGSIGELLTLVGMTLLYFAVRHGLSVELFVGLGKLASVLAVAGLTLRLFMAMAWWRPERFLALVATHDGSELGVRAALLTMMIFSLLSIAAGVEAIVGSFLAGALLAFVLRGKQALEEKLAVVGNGLFIPIFFIVVGLRFDPSAIDPRSLGVSAVLLVLSFGVRLLPSVVLMRQGLSARDIVGTASLLAAPLTLLVAIAALGHELGVLDDQQRGTLIVLAVLTGVVFPVVFRGVIGRRVGHSARIEGGPASG